MNLSRINQRGKGKIGRRANRPGSQRLVAPTPCEFTGLVLVVRAADGDRPRSARCTRVKSLTAAGIPPSGSHAAFARMESVEKTVAGVCQSTGQRLCSAQRNQPQRTLNFNGLRTGHALRLVPPCGTQPLSIPKRCRGSRLATALHDATGYSLLTPHSSRPPPKILLTIFIGSVISVVTEIEEL